MQETPDRPQGSPHWNMQGKKDTWSMKPWCLSERLNHAPDLWNNTNNFHKTKLEGYVRVFLGFASMLFLHSLAAQCCQFHSFRYCAGECMCEERLDGWLRVYSQRLHLCYCYLWFCYRSCPAHSRGLLWVCEHKGWRTGCLTFYKNLRRQVIICTLELHLCSSVPLVSLLGMEILTLLMLAESEVYFW